VQTPENVANAPTGFAILIKKTENDLGSRFRILISWKMSKNAQSCNSENLKRK